MSARELSVEERARMDRALAEHWKALSRAGDPARRINATEADFEAGYRAALAAPHEQRERVELLRRAYEVIRRGDVRLDTDCSGESSLAQEIRVHLDGARKETSPSGCTPCADCGIDYAAYWGASLVADVIWQPVVRTDPTVVLCPSCFAVRAAREVEELPGDGQRPDVDHVIQRFLVTITTEGDESGCDLEGLREFFEGAEVDLAGSIPRELTISIDEVRDTEREHGS